MTNETIFFENSAIKITSTRFIAKGKTFALGSIASFHKQSQEVKQTSKGMWLVLCVLAFLFFIPAGLLALFAKAFPIALTQLVMGGFGTYYTYKRFKSYQRKFTYKILLSVSSGEVAAYETDDGELAGKIIAGLESAIVARG